MPNRLDLGELSIIFKFLRSFILYNFEPFKCALLLTVYGILRSDGNLMIFNGPLNWLSDTSDISNRAFPNLILMLKAARISPSLSTL